MIELLNLKKIKLKFNINDVNEWCNVFIKKFKLSFKIILFNLTVEKYIVHDAKIKRKLAFYVIRHAKVVNINDVKN